MYWCRDGPQPQISPRRGVPQGCPLSVTLSVAWATAWSHTLKAVTHCFPHATCELVAYLDDLSICSDSKPTLLAALAATGAYCDTWRIALNLDKCSILANRTAAAKDRLQNTECPVRSAATQILLGIEAEPQQVGETMRLRCQCARETIGRMRTLQLPLPMARRLIATYVIPQLYGLHVMALCDELRNLQALLRKDIWGTARRSANWHAIQSFCVPATNLLPKGAQFAEVLRAWWQLGSDDRLRMQLLKLWHAGFVSTSD